MESPKLLAVPATARVTVLFNPKSAIGPPGQRATEDAAKLLGRAVAPLVASNPDELQALTPAALTGSEGYSRLGYPRSGLSRSDFVPWHQTDMPGQANDICS
jgi:hypothetical protein